MINITLLKLASLLNTQGLIAGISGKDNLMDLIAQDSNSNILATPSLMAMDNEQSIIKKFINGTTSRQEV